MSERKFTRKEVFRLKKFLTKINLLVGGDDGAFDVYGYDEKYCDDDDGDEDDFVSDDND